VPRDAPGIKVLRMLTVFGYDDAPHGHGEVLFENVRVPASNMLLGEGRGFEIAQGRLGPGRIHHCMRQIGVAERAIELMCRRATKRIAFGKPLADNDITLERIADSRIEIDQARLLVLHAAYMMDTVGNKAARQAIAEIKVAVPNITGRVVERAMQLHGGGGVSQEFPLASMWAHSRTLRFADGPDEVHRRQIGRLELRRPGHFKLLNQNCTPLQTRSAFGTVVGYSRRLSATVVRGLGECGGHVWAPALDREADPQISQQPVDPIAWPRVNRASVGPGGRGTRRPAG
jgi:alkylation response protein AidB-like acyl-CoA dehydrogenase